MTSQYGNFDVRRRAAAPQPSGGRDPQTGSSARDRRVLARRAERFRADAAPPAGGVSPIARIVGTLKAAVRRTGLGRAAA